MEPGWLGALPHLNVVTAGEIEAKAGILVCSGCVAKYHTFIEIGWLHTHKIVFA